jgi:hypothetical protein
MKATYEIERPVDIIGEGPRVTLAAGRYSTSDAAIQRKIGHYPGIRLISMESETAAATAGGTIGPGAVVSSEVEVRNHVGIQLREKRTGCSTSVGLGSRIAESDTDAE